MSSESRWAATENDGSSTSRDRTRKWQPRSSAGNRGRNNEDRFTSWRSFDNSTRGSQNRTNYAGARQQKSSSYQRESPDIDRMTRQMNTLSTSEVAGGMRKSTRNWDAEHRELKVGGVQDAPLISRTTDREDNVLLTSQGQHSMWHTIHDRIEKLTATYGSMTLAESGSTYQQELEQVIDLFRKLREAVFATKWANNDLAFSIQVFELSSTYCALAGNMGELLKSLKSLIVTLYPTALKAKELTGTFHLKMDPKNHSHYTALYILYHVCYTKSTAAILQLIQPGHSHPDIKFAVSIMNSILHSSYHQFFQLHQQSPWPAFTSMLNMHVPSMQELACKVMSASYYTTSIDWVKKSSSLSDVNDDTAMQLIQRWSGGRVDRVDDHRLLWFKRGKIVRS
ncbi:hypothetical protein INT44_001414 [Umbelopsis vinacea]|uniref:SAC3/GANP/THP3 conserved domain-containing protein n=1 Tax=Umbelopsis vinacea TaxID=44442 RepID=A0A8H7QB82_9FUNG|nr:hypothetical protein INT44_001414 [Umbelopsis vinacea]